MSKALKEHLPVLALITLVGVSIGAFGLMQVYGNAVNMSFEQFAWAVFLVPCAVMLVASFAMAATARTINRQLYLAIIIICLATGGISIAVTNGWFLDQTIADMLLANSPEGTQIIPIMNAPWIIIRDIAAFVVAPTVGSILGVWVGSRIHPMERAR